jgi:hypothetical protein
VLEQIIGTDTKRGIGKYIKIQDDLSSNGYRIWYSAEDKIVAATYVTYD